MEYLFAALRFTEDENLCDRVYWYRTEFALATGERVLAPVGSHDRLQCAVVERVVSASEENAPYEVALCKKVAAKQGARKLTAGGIACLELGGVKYDEKHYTDFHRILIADELPPDCSALRAYGVEAFLPAEDIVLEEFPKIDTCMLIYGASARTLAAQILADIRGNAEGISQETAARLFKKLTH